MRDLANCNDCNDNVGSLSRFTSSPECKKAVQGIISRNTEANTLWAVHTFNAWVVNCSFLGASEAVPDDLLASHDSQLVCKWLHLFVMETRKSDGSPYPPSCLRSLVCGLNHVLQNNKAPFSVVDKNDHRFHDLLKMQDLFSNELHREGVEMIKHSAKVIDHKH